MSKKIKIYDDKISLSRPFSRISERKSDCGNWLDGEVVTKNGIVSIYSQGDSKSFHCSRLDFSYKGKLYMRNYTNKKYSAQYLVTLSDRFSQEIVNKNK